MKEVTVIIVNYRVKYFLTQTLYSVSEALRDTSHEIFVIDNNSQDDSIDYVSQHFPDINYILNKENVGFARANNQAIEKADSKFTLILNPDTIITRHAITAAISLMNSDDKCGGIGTKMIDGNGAFLPESKRSFPTPWVSFCKIFGLSKLFPYSPIFARYHVRYLSDKEINKVDILAGAYMFIRTSLLKDVHGFDESFFMYGEDIDLSYRITEKGYSNYYLPQAIIHYKGESTKKDSYKYVKVFYEAMLIFFKKHYPHYSSPYYLFIKVGIFARAFASLIKRAIYAFLPKHKDADNSKWLLSTDDAEPIRKILLSENVEQSNIAIYESALSNVLNDKLLNIVLDNRKYSYEQIVEFIQFHTDANIRFHIYFSQCNTIMTPKMQSL
ncbi:MAG: glycosyltransferase family 2 protein [Muribaculaceae bacterium]|nr:glycosyltransferase family 2 protein [Muribaculaceae bacterium]